MQPAEVQPAEVQPAEVQPAEVQPAEVQPAEVQPTEEQKTVLSAGEIRKGASKSYASVGKVTSGQTVKVIDTFKNSLGETWYRLDMNSFKGWVQAAVFEKGQVAPPPAKIDEKKVLSPGEIRKGASKSYASVGKVTSGQTVKVIDTFKNSLGETWYRLDMNSFKGWVQAAVFEKSSVTLPPANIPIKGDSVYTANNSVKARSGATTSYKVVATLPLNKQFTVVDTFNNAKGETWIRVQISSKTYGWIPLSELQEEAMQVKTLYISASTANLRSGPSLSSAVVDQAKKDTQLTSIQKSGEWYKVMTSDNKVMWAHQSVVTEKQPIIENGTKYVASNSAELRRGASAGYKVVETVKKNARLTVMDQFTNSLGEKWLRVKTASGNVGWMLESQTTNETPNVLPTPPVSEGNTIVWGKSSSSTVNYSVLSNNRIKITGTLNGANKSSVPGIKSIETGSNTTTITFEPNYTFTLINNGTNVTLAVMPTGLAGKRIVIDAGHGAHDPGAVGPNGVREKDINLATALKLQTELEKKGAIVTMTRSNDKFLQLSERTSIANKLDYDAFISIHTNSASSSSAKGTETYYNKSNFNNLRSKEMAADIQKHLVASIGLSNRGVKTANYHVITKNEIPSVLVELAFIVNPKEEALLNSSSFQQKAAVGIRKGLEEYFSSF